MSNLTSFKEFVKVNPNLVSYVKTGEMSWQKFYEMYDLYGEKHEIWNNYQKKEISKETTAKASLTVADVVSWVKNMDIDKMQEGINSVQRVIGVLQDFGTNGEASTTYKPRPVYKHFED